LVQEFNNAGANGALPVEEMEEDDAKKLRRKINNRESARRSRQKKADEINRLQAMVAQKDAELTQCKQTMGLLQSYICILAEKVGELGGSVNDPGILQALCNAPVETQPLAQVLAGETPPPPLAATTVNVIQGTGEQEQAP
jgi:hypothetical protein